MRRVKFMILGIALTVAFLEWCNVVVRSTSTSLGRKVSKTLLGEKMVPYGHLAHQAATDHIEACLRALEQIENGEEPTDAPLTVEKFCGCPQCIVRETLFAAWPYIFWSSNDEHTPVPRIPLDLQDALVKSNFSPRRPGA